MALSLFLVELFEKGGVTVTPSPTLIVDEKTQTILECAECDYRQTLAGEAPDFSLNVATWAAKLFYHICQFEVCRDFSPGEIAEAFREKCPEAHSPSTDYSADLIFRYLPDLVLITKGLASDDPLLQHLLQLAREWPLSSVGVLGVGTVDIEGFVHHPGLLQLYVDRILVHSDLTRLGAAPVNKALRSALGAFPELCPAVSKHLNQSAHIV